MKCCVSQAAITSQIQRRPRHACKQVRHWRTSWVKKAPTSLSENWGPRLSLLLKIPLCMVSPNSDSQSDTFTPRKCSHAWAGRSELCVWLASHAVAVVSIAQAHLSSGPPSSQWTALASSLRAPQRRCWCRCYCSEQPAKQLGVAAAQQAPLRHHSAPRLGPPLPHHRHRHLCRGGVTHRHLQYAAAEARAGAASKPASLRGARVVTVLPRFQLAT
jgi:hypothetical protein